MNAIQLKQINIRELTRMDLWEYIQFVREEGHIHKLNSRFQVLLIQLKWKITQDNNTDSLSII